MKKLMFIATAALCGAVMAEGEIVSANVVGYQNKATESTGLKMITSTFMPVGVSKEDAKVSDIKVNEAWNWAQDIIQFVDPTTGGTATFEYDSETYNAFFTYVPVIEDFCDEAGWYQAEAALEGVFITIEEAGFNTLPYGEGFFIQTYTSEEGGLVFSGEVAKGEQTIVTGTTGLKVMGNPLPVQVDFADIAVNEAWNWAQDIIQFVDSTTGGTATFEYDSETYNAFFTYVPVIEDFCDKAGWYQAEAALEGVFITIEEAGFTSLKAGEGFCIQTYTSEEGGLQFPAVL